jgi:hypothetical protein
MTQTTSAIKVLLISRRDSRLRIRFVDGETYVLQTISERPQESEDEADLSGLWCGEIVSTEGLSPNRKRLFSPGSGLDFRGSDILEIRDDQTSRVLFSKSTH